MAVTVTITEVQTADRQPIVAPHRISALSGKNDARVDWTVGLAAPATTRLLAHRIRVGGSNRANGRTVMMNGIVCGVSRCPMRPMRAPAGVGFTDHISFTEASDGGADGARDCQVHVWTDAEGVG